ncbi:YceI family protein [Aliamphritea spongicola]
MTRLAGQLSDSGALSVQLDLDSIETNIGIRNERMREHLFETSKFKTATLQSQLPADVMQTVKMAVLSMPK